MQAVRKFEKVFLCAVATASPHPHNARNLLMNKRNNHELMI
jgi:hypothetical protein